MTKKIELVTPFREEVINQLKVGDVVTITGNIYTGRDAVLPKIVKAAEEGTLKDLGMSHKTSVVTYVLLIVFIFLFVFGSAAYIAYRCKLNYDRGNKLTVNEENKSKTSTTVQKI